MKRLLARRSARLSTAALMAAWLFAPRAAFSQVPIDGFFPQVGFTLTDEFLDDITFFPVASQGVTGNQLGPGGAPTYDIALLDTGAGFSLLTDEAFSKFALDQASPGEPDGYQGTEFVTIGGATGELLAPINDPFGLYVGGLQDRTSTGGVLTMSNAALPGQTNVSTITLPPSSDLPNIVGLPFASRYATSIRNDSPQVFEIEGRTVRTPTIEFLPLGGGGDVDGDGSADITRKAPLNLNPGATFAQPPSYLLNIANFDINAPQENPSLPTIMQGGLFLNVQAENGDGDLGGSKEFFFDTGASVTVVSELNALNLGFDVTIDEPEFTISVVGSGGLLSDIPGFFVEEFTITALGGSITANNVPVIVLDVADPSDAGNVVEGIVGTNLLSGRNIVIDPNPSLGGGGESAGVYISDPVTGDFAWQAAGAARLWSDPSAWDAAATPDLLSKTKLAPATGVDQVSFVVGDREAWDVTINGGAAGESMTLFLVADASLTVFSGVTIGEGGVVQLSGAKLDAQYLDFRGGTLTGSGVIETGSGPIVGQVEIIDGTLAPGDGVGVLEIEGRVSTGAGAVFQFEIGGATAGAEYDQLVVSDSIGLDGRLEVSLVDLGPGLFEPSIGDTFTLITHAGQGGEFDTLALPTDYLWEVNYLATSLVLEVTGLRVPGDFNGDGFVTAADYTTWRDGFGDPYTIADYQAWKATMLGASASAAQAAVPEPSCAALLAMAAALVTGRRRS